MKIKFLSLVVFACFFSLFSSAQSVDEIVNHYLDATGGKANWAKLKSVKFIGSVDIGPNMKAPFTLYLKDKTKSRFELEIQGMKMVNALDGDSGWNVVPFSGKMDPERMNPEEVKQSKKQADFTGDLYDYQAKGNTVEYLGKEDMEGTDTYKLKVTRKNGDVVYMYLDATSYLSLKETTKQKFQDKEIESVTLMSNYKDVDGIKFPFTIEVRGSEQDAMGQAMTFDTIEVNPVIEDAIFKMPPMKSAVQPSEGEVK